MSNNYENIICEAIETLVDKAVSQAEYDKTIQATIIEHTDATIGKYKVKYQDSIFYAYATDVSANYSKGSSVYVLIHANNMEKDKTIIGAVEKLGTNYISIIDDEDTYNYIGKNLTTIKEEQGICSYKSYSNIYNDFKILFDKNNTDENNLISLTNIEEVNHYLNNSSILVIGGNFRTNLSEEQKKDITGEYGLIYTLTFKDSEGKEYQKTFKIDNNSMQGIPYEYINGSEQKNFFEIEKESFVSIDKIIFYCKNFQCKSSNKPNDIFISDIFLQGAEKIPQDDLNGCYLTLNTPQGSILSDDINSIILKATLKVKGKPIQDTNNIKYYWFRENPRILRDSDHFHLTGGIGWECLNFIDTKENDEGNPELSFVTLNNTFKIKQGDFLSKTIKYKCVAIYDNMSFSKEISILNLDYQFNIYLETDSGDTVFSKYGEPIIKCVIKDNNNTEITDNDNFKFSFSWASINLNNQFSSLANLENEENKIKINMSQIFSSITIKCAVYKTDINNKIDYFIGTAELLLRNRTREEMQKYSLVIENGNQVFKYSVSGVSPCVESLENPFIIPELTFSFYDPNERKIEVIDKNIWYFPVHNTMLELVYDNIPPLDETGEYYMITNPKDRKISYKIRNQYNPSYSNNSIKLTVFKDNVPYTAKTNFLFTKEGEIGTNGTDYVLRIIPNYSESSDNFPTYAELTKIQGKKEFYWNFDLKEENVPLKLQIWQSGILVYEGSGWGNDVKIQAEEASSANILWRNLIHTYFNNKKDGSNFILNNEESRPKITYDLESSNLEAPANLIQAQAQINNCYYYAVAPIITSEVSDNKYRIKLKENTGFFSVLYSSDGMYPQYDSQYPFEIEVDGVDSLEKLSYNWSVRNEINGTNLNDLNESYLSKIPKENEKGNTATFKPINRCKAEALNVSIRCEVEDDQGTKIGYINIPIYFYLNRYGQAALNGWDGNSIDINENGGYILSPQIGAGHKEEDDNSFTGVFMGEVKEYNSNSEILHNGILGYHKGEKSLFINAVDGSAIFGKYSSHGQIIIDPKSNYALLYSTNFFKDYSSDGKPTNYGEGNKTGEGMLINLSLPEIRFGNGNFIVNSNGNLTAVNGYFKGELHSALGDIGGWKIEKKSLYHDGYTVGMGAFNKVYSETEENLGDDANYGIQVAVQIANKDAENGYETKNKAAAFWAGGSISINEDNTNENNITILNNPAFFVSHDGYLKATEASIGAGANPIFVGKSVPGVDCEGNAVNVVESAIYTFKKNSFSGAPSQNGFYLGESGIAIGTYKKTDENGKPIAYNAFEVNKKGDLIARQGYIGDGAKGWKIGAEALVHNKKTSMFMGEKKDFNSNPYKEKDGTYLGVDGFELGFSQLNLKYKVPLPPTEDSETVGTETKKKQIYAPGFWVKRGEFNSVNKVSGQVGINRGILAGSWEISEEGIASIKYNDTNVNSYLGESKPNPSYKESVPIPSSSGTLTSDTGNSINISTRTEKVRLLSFCLPNQIDRAIGLWGDPEKNENENFTYSYQRIVAGRPLQQEETRLAKFGAKKWAWELMDDGSMYARRAVISTNFYKTFKLPEKDSSLPTDGVYIGPEGLCVGKKFAIDKEGNILRGISNYHITKIEYSGTEFVNFHFKSNVDPNTDYNQNFTIARDTEGRITALKADKVGNHLPPDYSFNTITVTY